VRVCQSVLGWEVTPHTQIDGQVRRGKTDKLGYSCVDSMRHMGGLERGRGEGLACLSS